MGWLNYHVSFRGAGVRGRVEKSVMGQLENFMFSLIDVSAFSNSIKERHASAFLSRLISGNRT